MVAFELFHMAPRIALSLDLNRSDLIQVQLDTMFLASRAVKEHAQDPNV